LDVSRELGLLSFFLPFFLSNHQKSPRLKDCLDRIRVAPQKASCIASIKSPQSHQHRSRSIF
jgi:hypothetical protein